MVERKVGQLVASMVEETAELRDEKMADKTDVVKVGKMVGAKAERSVVKKEGMKVGKMAAKRAERSVVKMEAMKVE